MNNTNNYKEIYKLTQD